MLEQVGDNMRNIGNTWTWIPLLFEKVHSPVQISAAILQEGAGRPGSGHHLHQKARYVFPFPGISNRNGDTLHILQARGMSMVLVVLERQRQNTEYFPGTQSNAEIDHPNIPMSITAHECFSHGLGNRLHFHHGQARYPVAHRLRTGRFGQAQMSANDRHYSGYGAKPKARKDK